MRRIHLSSLRAVLPIGWMAVLLVLLICGGRLVEAQLSTAGATPLDRVIAVVNDQVILASDLDLELRIMRILPRGADEELSRTAALERLTTRALIVQQILQENSDGMVVDPKELEDALTELRQNLAACKVRDCRTDAGWAAYLAALGLTPEEVSTYWVDRVAVLRFIEQRFRSGIRITPEEVQKYYQDSVVPEYAKRADVPPLDKVSPRIEEVLLQGRVNDLLNDWLKSLRDQGQVEVLDPALAPVEPAAVAPVPIQPNGGKL